MALVGNNVEDSLFVPSDSELDDDFEILTSPPCPSGSRPTRASARSVMALPGMPLPQMQSASTQTTGRHSTRMVSERPGASRRSNNISDGAVIDLTEEPDSPEITHQQPVSGSSSTRPRLGHESQNGVRDHRSTSTNPRRTNSVRRTTPPRLARSDEAPLGRGNVIDLTLGDDSDSELNTGRQSAAHPTLRTSHRRRAAAFPRHARHQQWNGTLPGFDALVGMTTEARSFADPPSGLEARRHANIRGPFGLASSLMQAMGDIRNTFGGGGMMFPMAGLDVTRNAGEGEAEEVIPPAEPIASAREGFSRDTKMTTEDDEDMDIAVCPACEAELAYDPSELVKKVHKGKRKPGDHHFWALKQCGHVYCADCFEGRSKKTGKARFPMQGAGDPMCAVDGCSTKAKTKSQWVGIFL